MKVPFVFTCLRCGCQTPSTATIADDEPGHRKVYLTADCHHCGAKLARIRRVADLRGETERRKRTT